MLASTVKFSTYGRYQGRLTHGGGRTRSAGGSSPVATETSGPNSVPQAVSEERRGSTPAVTAGCTDVARRLRLNGQCSTFRCLPGRTRSARIRVHGRTRSAIWLLRKEVIQPHLPVRLPCYDLVLIAGPTFDGSLHKGWATGFGCYRLS